MDLDFCRAEPGLSREEGSHTKMRCTVCQREFKSLPALNGHMRSHGGLRTHPTSLKMVRTTLILTIYGVVCVKDIVWYEIRHAEFPHWFKFLFLTERWAHSSVYWGCSNQPHHLTCISTRQGLPDPNQTYAQPSVPPERWSKRFN